VAELIPTHPGTRLSSFAGDAGVRRRTARDRGRRDWRRVARMRHVNESARRVRAAAEGPAETGGEAGRLRAPDFVLKTYGVA